MTGTEQKVAALVDVCNSLANGETETAAAILASRYPFKSVEKSARKYTIRQGFTSSPATDSLTAIPASDTWCDD